ncbi:MAG TPA: ABC transporter ATP-binding protein [Trebonia sp.]|nr:ABC transporter ATP-binding protein [Trebonia sp.]
MPQLGHRAASCVLHRAQGPVGLPRHRRAEDRSGQHLAGRRHLDHHQADVVADDVVQLGRDPSPLGVHGGLGRVLPLTVKEPAALLAGRPVQAADPRQRQPQSSGARRRERGDEPGSPGRSHTLDAATRGYEAHPAADAVPYIPGMSRLRDCITRVTPRPALSPSVLAMDTEDLTGSSTSQAVVQLDGVRKSYDGTPALNGVSLRIRRGEAVAVMGPSGCGKSTLLNMVAGLDRPTSGSVVVHGEDLGRLDEKGLALFRRRRIGMIFQFFNLIDDLSALDNVALAAQLTGTAPAQARRRALELLGELGIAHRKDAYPAVLSGGERQRVAVARALMNRPAVLLADEPTGALDTRSGEQVMDLLIDLNQIGQTLLLVTHEQNLAIRCASRVITLSDGNVVGDVSMERAS